MSLNFKAFSRLIQYPDRYSIAKATLKCRAPSASQGETARCRNMPRCTQSIHTFDFNFKKTMEGKGLELEPPFVNPNRGTIASNKGLAVLPTMYA